MAGPYRMKRVQEPAAYAWQRRQQATGKSMAQQVDEANQAIVRRARSYKAADPAGRELPENSVSADFNDRLAKAQVFAQKQGLAWSGPCTYGLAVAHVEYRAARANHLIQGLAARIEALEKQLSETKTIAAHTSTHALTFGGNFVLENAYNEGTVTIYKGAAFIAGRDISANLTFPPRQGSGWIPL